MAAPYFRSATFRTLFAPQALTGLSLGAIAAVAAAPRLGGALGYPDFLVGASALDASNPQRNLIGALVFLVTACVAAALFQAASLRLERKFGEETVEALAGAHWAALLPDCAFLAIHLFRGGLDPGFLALGGILKAALLAALALMNLLRSLSGRAARAITEASLLAMTLALFDGLAILTVLSRFSPASAAPQTPVLAAVAVAAMLAGLGLLEREGVSVERRFRRALTLLELPLPLLALSAWPTPGWPSRIWLPLSLAAFMAACWIEWRRRQREAGRSVLESLTPLCLCAVLFFTYSNPPATRPVMNADDYHWGEELLPYQQWKLYGKAPFVELNSPRGIQPWLGGALGDFWYTGQPDTLPSGIDAVWSAILIAIFLAARRLAGTGLGFLIAYWFSASYFRLALITVALFLLASLVARRPWRVLALVWFWATAIVALFTPSSGASFLAGGALALAGARLLLGPAPGDRGWTVRRVLGYSGLALLPLALFPRIYWGLARYILDNAGANAAANALAINFAAPHNLHGALSSPVVFHIVRLSLLISVALLAASVVRTLAGASPRRAQAVFLALGAGCVLLCSLPYALGRVDPGNLSRAGGYSLWAAAILWPVLLAVRGAFSKPVHACLAVALLAGGWAAGSETSLPVWESMQRKASLPALAQDLRPDPDFALGRADLEPDHRRQLLQVKRALARYVRAGETYLDWTNHSARYQYLGYPCPIPEMAAYNSYSESTQRRIVEILKQAPPPVILVEAANVYFDEGAAPLRTPAVYRYFLESGYVPVDEDGMTLLIRPDRVASAPGEEERLGLLERAFFPPELRLLPVAWGRSFASLEDHMGAAVRAPGEGFSIDTTSLGISGKSASLMTLDVVAARTDPVPVQVYWQSELTRGALAKHVRFLAQPGRLIVPMDVHPRWYLSRRIERVVLDVEDAPRAGGVQIENVQFRGRR